MALARVRMLLVWSSSARAAWCVGVSLLPITRDDVKIHRRGLLLISLQMKYNPIVIRSEIE